MLDKVLDYITITAWVFYLLFLGFFTLRALQFGGLKEAARALLSLRSLLALLIVIGLSLLSTSLVYIEPQEVGVVLSLVSRDGYRQRPFRSGLHFVVPLAEQVLRYPIYWQNFTMSTEPLEGNQIGNDAIAARTSDGQAVYVDCTVIFRIDANEAIRIHIDFQDRYIDDYVRPILRGIIRTEVSQFTADEVNSSRRKNLESNLQELLREAFSDKGFVLDRFLLRNIAFSQQYASAIEAKQVAEQAQIQRDYEAEQLRRLARGRADAAVIEGQATADVIRLKAEAEAEALRLIAEALKQSEDLITYRYVDKLSPGIRVMLVPNDNPYLLPLPNLESLADIPVSSPITPTLTLTDTTTTDETLITPTPTPRITRTPTTAP